MAPPAVVTTRDRRAVAPSRRACVSCQRAEPSGLGSSGSGTRTPIGGFRDRCPAVGRSQNGWCARWELNPVRSVKSRLHCLCATRAQVVEPEGLEPSPHRLKAECAAVTPQLRNHVRAVRFSSRSLLSLFMVTCRGVEPSLPLGNRFTGGRAHRSATQARNSKAPPDSSSGGASTCQGGEGARPTSNPHRNCRWQTNAREPLSVAAWLVFSAFRT